MRKNIVLPKLPPIFIIRLVEKLKSFLKNLERKLTPNEVILIDYVTHFWAGRAIGVATELNIPDILQDGPKHIEELARITQTHEPSLYRLMRTLSGHGIFREDKNKNFMLTKLSACMTESGNKSVKYFILHQNSEPNWKQYGEMLHCVKTGEHAARKLYNMEPFEYLEKHPAINNIFNRSMTSTSEMSSLYMVSFYPFSSLQTIVDVGGGQGFFLSCILHKNKQLEGIVFDLPHVVEEAKANMELFKVSSRCSVVAGSFFESVPENAEAYLLKNIIHDWDDEKCLAILKNIHKAMKPGGKLICIETIIQNDNKASFGKNLDIEMLVGTNGGRERTLTEFKNLYEKAGFKITAVFKTPTPFNFIEGIKA
ncbi:MAG: methyltransferase [Bacteroidota bacterium]